MVNCIRDDAFMAAVTSTLAVLSDSGALYSRAGDDTWFLDHIYDSEKVTVVNFGSLEDIEGHVKGGLFRDAIRILRELVRFDVPIFTNGKRYSQHINAYVNQFNVLIFALSVFRNVLISLVSIAYPGFLHAACFTDGDDTDYSVDGALPESVSRIALINT